ncbi:MAG: hypothetical protein J3Q66DRAFT_57821 [Benniella sp.]|nr:MAG: hypothetical protein J3Q66DRAFT_57821 [Benniella sp.]
MSSSWPGCSCTLQKVTESGPSIGRLVITSPSFLCYFCWTFWQRHTKGHEGCSFVWFRGWTEIGSGPTADLDRHLWAHPSRSLDKNVVIITDVRKKNDRSVCLYWRDNVEDTSSGLQLQCQGRWLEIPIIIFFSGVAVRGCSGFSNISKGRGKKEGSRWNFGEDGAEEQHEVNQLDRLRMIHKRRNVDIFFLIQKRMQCG